MASSQNTMYTSYPCPLWGKDFDDLVGFDDLVKAGVEAGSDPTTGDRYHFIRPESFQQHLSFLPILHVNALLIRDEYQQLYNFLSQKSLPTRRVGVGAYSGVAVIGQPGIGQLQLHCVSPEDYLW